MKKIFILIAILSSSVSFGQTNDTTKYGKKVKVGGTKAEIYYKGEGVTEDDAKKTGEFLKGISPI